MTILVTGSSGFVGSHLVPSLRAKGNYVIGIDREEPGMESCAPDVLIKRDLLQDSALEAGIQGVDAVYHLAAAKDDWGISREEYFRENVDVTRAVIEVSRRYGVRNHIFYSTVAVHGSGSTRISESAPYRPIIPYAESKVECEMMYHQMFEVWNEARILILRPSAIYGPLQTHRTNIYRLIDAIHRKRFLMIGNGSALKTTSYIENLVAANHFLVDRLAPGVQSFIYVDDPVMSTAELVTMIHANLGRDPSSLSLPLHLAKPLARVADVAASVTGIDFPITAARIEKFCTPTNFDASAIRALGFEQPVSNDAAVDRTVAWQLDEYVALQATS